MPKLVQSSAKSLDIRNTYITDKYCEFFVRSIADSIRVDQNAHFGESPISIISDGSTDCSSKEAESVSMRSATKGKVRNNMEAYILLRYTSNILKHIFINLTWTLP